MSDIEITLAQHSEQIKTLFRESAENKQLTESVTPYTNPQIVAKGGTEEYVDNRDVAIPVGHNTKYQGVLL